MTASKMPTEQQARVLLNVLAGRYVLDGVIAVQSWLDVLVFNSWVDNGRHPPALTETGRTALADYLLRDFRGPVVVHPRQVAATAFEARAMLARMAGRSAAEVFGGRRVSASLMYARGWLDGNHGPTPLGGDAIAAFLLRGWRA